jgi:hypothetical protein
MQGCTSMKYSDYVHLNLGLFVDKAGAALDRGIVVLRTLISRFSATVQGGTSIKYCGAPNPNLAPFVINAGRHLIEVLWCSEP